MFLLQLQINTRLTQRTERLRMSTSRYCRKLRFY